MSTSQVDIAIVGGGAVGLTLGIALSALPLRVAILEKQGFYTDTDEGLGSDSRVYSLSVSTARLFESLGFWPELQPLTAPIHSVHVSEKGRFGKAELSALPYGYPALAYTIPARSFMHRLQAYFQRVYQGLTLDSAELKHIQATPDKIELSHVQHGSVKTLSCRLLIGADGHASAVKRLSNIQTKHFDYHQSALVCAIKTGKHHGYRAYERFTQEGTLALLPLKQPCQMALICMQTNALAEEYLNASEQTFLEKAQAAFGNRLGEFLSVGPRQVYPLQRHMAETLTTNRTVLVGHAAQTLHPLGGQSLNLGLRDVSTLVAMIRSALMAEENVIGQTEWLAAYAKKRALDRQATAGWIDRILTIYTHPSPMVQAIRPFGLMAVNLVPGLAHRLLKQSMGL